MVLGKAVKAEWCQNTPMNNDQCVPPKSKAFQKTLEGWWEGCPVINKPEFPSGNLGLGG